MLVRWSRTLILHSEPSLKEIFHVLCRSSSHRQRYLLQRVDFELGCHHELCQSFLQCFFQELSPGRAKLAHPDVEEDLLIFHGRFLPCLWTGSGLLDGLGLGGFRICSAEVWGVPQFVAFVARVFVQNVLVGFSLDFGLFRVWSILNFFEDFLLNRSSCRRCERGQFLKR